MLTPDFKEFAALLNSNGVEYLVVGGYALAAYGHPRYTGDLDFWIGTNHENAERVLTALEEFGLTPSQGLGSSVLGEQGRRSSVLGLGSDGAEGLRSSVLGLSKPDKLQAPSFKSQDQSPKSQDQRPKSQDPSPKSQ